MNRKLTLLLLVIICTAGNLVTAQGLRFGLKGGADLHKVSGKPFNEQFTFGYHLGGLAEIGLSPKLSIQPEVYFSQVNVDTGANFSDVYPQLKSISKIKLSYMNIPILLNYKPNNFVALQAGPQFGILMDQSSSLVVNGKDAFKKGDFSMLAGLQLYISKIMIYGRYVIGLNDINDISDQDSWKNQVVHLGIGIRL